MSAPVTPSSGNTPSQPGCDQALDYLYEMLSGEDKARYLVHLGTCTRCQSELESFGRVREVAAAVLPTVEPGERLTGALHAQLMHEAAQRKPAGKILPFARRLVRHPAYAAAAGILLIGGAVGLQWSRGKLTMMPSEPAMSAPAAATPTAATGTTAPDPQPMPVVAAAPSPEAQAPAAEPLAPPAELSEKSKLDGVAQGQALDPSTRLKVVEDQKLERRGPPEADKNSEYSARSRKVGSADSLDSMLNDRGGEGAAGVGVVGGKGGGTGTDSAGYARGSLAKDSTNAGPVGGSRQATSAPEPRSPAAAPAAPAKTAKKEAAAIAPGDAQPDRKPATSESKAPAARRDEPARAEREQAPVGRVAGNKASNSDLDDGLASSTTQRAPAQNAAPAPKPAPQRVAADEEMPNRGKADLSANNSADAIETERRRAATLAQAGRCDEASSLYAALDHKAPDRLSAQDRLSYVRCLRTLGRLEPAQSELDQLRASKQQQPLPASALNAEQKAIDVDMKRRAANTPASTGERRSSSKAKKAARAVAADALEAPSAPTESNTKNLTY